MSDHEPTDAQLSHLRMADTLEQRYHTFVEHFEETGDERSLHFAGRTLCDIEYHLRQAGFTR